MTWVLLRGARSSDISARPAQETSLQGGAQMDWQGLGRGRGGGC